MTIAFVQIFARRLRRMKLYTIADVFAVRFGKNAAFIPSLFQIFVYSIPTLALQFIGMGTIFKIFFGWDLQVGIVAGALLIFVYTLLGGLPSAILTDTIQSVILYIGVCLLLILGIKYAGGIPKIIDFTPSHMFSPVWQRGLWKIPESGVDCRPILHVVAMHLATNIRGQKTSKPPSGD